jgi:hypothetical protein
MCGTWIRSFGNDNQLYKFPLTPKACKVQLLFNICMMHPTIVFRKDLVEKYGIRYKQEFFPADDLELFTVNSDNVQYANIPEVLYKYRSHPDQASHTMFDTHNKLKIEVLLISLRKILPDITNEEIELHEKISSTNYEYTFEFLKKCKVFFERMIKNNGELKIFDQSALEEKLQQEWFNICTELSSHGLFTSKIYKASSLVKVSHFNWRYIKFYIKNFLIKVKVSK